MLSPVFSRIIVLLCLVVEMLMADNISILDNNHKIVSDGISYVHHRP